MSIAACIVIPIYNHKDAIGATLARLVVHRLPLIVVDDGSDEATQQVLARLAREYAPQLTLLRRAVNGGKGAAVMAGLRAARAAGYSHALQIDADGQHDAADVPAFIDAAQRAPDALVTGQPVYDDSVPRARRYGRYVTHAWVWIETLSLEIRDAMCGFRVYPLLATCRLLDEATLPARMDFDIEILVRLHWRGLPFVRIPTRVTYAADGVSHFDAWRDNARISRSHARLFAGMIVRLPVLVARRFRPRGAWHLAPGAGAGRSTPGMSGLAEVVALAAHGSRGPVPQGLPSRDSSLQDAPSRGSPPQDALSRDVSLRGSARPGSLRQDSPAQDSSPQDSSLQDSPSQDLPLQDSLLQDLPAQGLPSQDSPLQDSPAQDSSSQDSLAQDLLSQDSLAQGLPLQDSPSQGSPSSGPSSQNSALQDASPQDSPSQWWRMTERGSGLGMRLLVLGCRVFGARFTSLWLYPVVAYFVVTGRAQRAASRQYFTRLAAFVLESSPGKSIPVPRPGWLSSYRHMLNFAQASFDKLAAWLNPDAVRCAKMGERRALDELVATGQGALVIGAHLGNLEMARALVAHSGRKTVTAVIHTEHARRFNQMLSHVNQKFPKNLLEVSDFGPETALMMQERIARGELLVIVGDRAPVRERGGAGTIAASFLGRNAPFPQGPFVLAHALECPVYLYFCLKQKGGYALYFEPFATRIHLPRNARAQQLAGWARRYAARLEHYCTLAPYQWFNFYDFWQGQNNVKKAVDKAVEKAVDKAVDKMVNKADTHFPAPVRQTSPATGSETQRDTHSCMSKTKH